MAGERWGLLVVSRDEGWAHAAKTRWREASPALGLNAVDTLHRYRGFDGEHWPGGGPPGTVDIAHGLASPSNMDRILEYTRTLRLDFDVLFCAVGDADVGAPVRSGLGSATFAGFDIGVLESSDNHYSVILNELLLGQNEGLRWLSGHLNRFLLFDTVEEADAAMRSRAVLSKTAADLEDLSFDTQGVVGVWILNVRL